MSNLFQEAGPAWDMAHGETSHTTEKKKFQGNFSL